MVPMTTETVVASIVTSRLFFVQVRNSVSHSSFGVVLERRALRISSGTACRSYSSRSCFSDVSVM